MVSNCVSNLSPDKSRVFAEMLRVLKPGGEFYFSDVFADRHMSPVLQADSLLRGECLGGALYVEDFRRQMPAVGCLDVRVVDSHPVPLLDPEIERRIGLVEFRSLTVRGFKLPHAFLLDDNHRLEGGRPLPVCDNTADMLSATRYAPNFRLAGAKSTHFGLFDCGLARSDAPAAERPGSCC